MSDNSTTVAAQVLLPGQTLTKLPPWRRPRPAAPNSPVEEPRGAVLTPRPWRQNTGDEGISSQERETPQAEASADEQSEVDALVNESAEATELLVHGFQSAKLQCEPPPGLKHLASNLPHGPEDLEPPPGLGHCSLQDREQHDEPADEPESGVSFLEDAVKMLIKTDRGCSFLEDVVKILNKTEVSDQAGSESEDTNLGSDEMGWSSPSHTSQTSSTSSSPALRHHQLRSNAPEFPPGILMRLNAAEFIPVGTNLSDAPTFNAAEFIPVGINLSDAPTLNAAEFIPVGSNLSDAPAPSSVPLPLFTSTVKKESRTANTVRKESSKKAGRLVYSKIRTPLPVGPVGPVGVSPSLPMPETASAWESHYNYLYSTLSDPSGWAR